MRQPESIVSSDGRRCPARQRTPAERQAITKAAIRLREQGFSYSRIAVRLRQDLGITISTATVFLYLKDL